MVEIYLNQPVTVNQYSIPMTIQLIKVLLLSKMSIDLIFLILILLVNVLNSMTREGVFQDMMNTVDSENHLNRILEVHPTKLVLLDTTKVIQLGITNSSHHHVASLTVWFQQNERQKLLCHRHHGRY